MPMFQAQRTMCRILNTSMVLAYATSVGNFSKYMYIHLYILYTNIFLTACVLLQLVIYNSFLSCILRLRLYHGVLYYGVLHGLY